MPTNPPFPSVTIKSNFQTGDKPTQAQFEQFIDGVKAIDDNSPLNNLAATTIPTSNDDSNDGYSVGSTWINTITNAVYICVDASVGGAIWQVQGASSIADGNKGDLTVSGGGATWTLNTASVTESKLGSLSVTTAKVNSASATATQVMAANGSGGASFRSLVASDLPSASTSASGVVELATDAEVQTGTSTTLVVTPAGMKAGLNATGTAPTYAVRAWVNFNGSSGAIIASGNVSSVTRHATGEYSVNFTTSLPDGDYVLQGTANRSSIGPGSTPCTIDGPISATSSSCRFYTKVSTVLEDPATVRVSFVR